VSGATGARERLRADCERCVGLCCVAPAFSASADFAIDKPAGTPCPNLRDDFRCGIHERLRPRGFPGCAVYDCFGAGQRVALETFRGTDWRGSPEIARRMFAVFGVMRQLHELLWYLTEALRLELPDGLRDDLRGALDATERLAAGGPDDLVRLDVNAHRDQVNVLLRSASEQVRAELRPDPADRAGADLVGSDLRRADLRAASLRGAYLVGADLRRADLRGADLTGADLRGADLGGADLRGAIFVTQSQLDAARGDGGTRLPEPGVLRRPPHWARRRP
jgi:uncharacterized protein YjbI with pentapeptide repeats